MLRLSAAHFAILFSAYDGIFLHELPLGMGLATKKGSIELLPPMPAEIARDATAELLAEGFIELCRSSDDVTIAPEEALKIVADPTNWQSPLIDQRGYCHEAFLTKAGLEAYERAYTEFGQSVAAVFRKARAMDRRSPSAEEAE